MFLCTTLTGGIPSYTEVTDTATCSGYIQDQAVNFGLAGFTYSDANQLLGAVAGLFVLAFVLRAVIHFIQNR